MTDGLLLLEFRDAVHEGDGVRLLRCWRMLLLYFAFSGHTKYALEAFHLQAAVSATASLRVAQDLLNSRFINVYGGEGRNIPTDLHMEHLNRTLKDYLNGMGANISDRAIVQMSKALKPLMDIKLHPESLHDTVKSSMKDLQIQMHVFSYIPGRSFKNIKSHIAQCVNVAKLVAWVKEQQKKLTNNIALQNILQSHS